MPLLPLLPLLAAAAAPQGDACAALQGTTGAVTVDRATAVAPGQDWQAEPGREGRNPYAPTPVKVGFCRIEGRIEGTIGFELWLPAQWNGRLLGAGVGGDAGVYNYRDLSIRVAQGFAAVTTDSGHKITNARWMREPKARVDYEHRASHLTAQAAKALVARFYGQAPSRSYYLGCSGGGRQALKEMQNYPGDYDGVVAGAPGPYMPLQSVRMMWFSLEAQRKPLGALTDGDWAFYEARVTAACDGLDGVKDGVVENPARCRFPTASLLCKPGQGAGCLTAPRLAMLDAIIAPLKDERGKPLDWGLFPGVRTRPGPPSPLLRAMWADAVYDNPDWDAQSFRRTRDLDAVNRVMPELRADKTAIQGFIAQGHKAIIYQGWQDPSTNAGPTIRYYGALARANGGAEKLSQGVRLFMAPGMYHCRGGPGADLFGGSGHAPLPPKPENDVLWALVQWVEQGKAPASLVATRVEGEGVRFTRRLCPFPQSARYDGTGDAADAASYSCEKDPLLQAMFARQ